MAIECGLFKNDSVIEPRSIKRLRMKHKQKLM